MVKKDTIVERLERIYDAGRWDGSPIEIPVSVLFEDTIWMSPKGKKKKKDAVGGPGSDNLEKVFERLGTLNRVPHSYFGVREGLIKNVRDFSKNEITPEDVTALFEEGDDMTLGNFQSLGTPGDFFTRMNHWYYGAFGRRAFTFDGQVPKEISNDPLIQVAMARDLYERVAGGAFGDRDEIEVHRWGSGGIFEPAVAFIDEIVRLDNVNSTEVYPRLRCILSDISERSIAEQRERAVSDVQARAYMDAGVLSFTVHDAMAADRSSEIANISSSYMYDSISQPVVAKVNGKFYEVWYRAYLVNQYAGMSWIGPKMETRDGKPIKPEDFKRWLDEDNLERLSEVTPRCFNNIEWEAKLVEIDIGAYQNGRILEEMASGKDHAIIPTGQTSLKSLRSAISGLIENGVVQVFDLGISENRQDPRHDELISRYNGAVFMPVNLDMILRVMKDDGHEACLEHITDYMGRHFGQRVIPAQVLGLLAQDDEDFDRFYPFELMAGHGRISEIAEMVMQEEGYSPAGRNRFNTMLKKEGLMPWHRPCDRAVNHEDLISDFRESFRGDMMYRAFNHGPLWWFEGKDPTRGYDEIDGTFIRLGFDKRIKDHLFKHHREISERLDYQHLRVEKERRARL